MKKRCRILVIPGLPLMTLLQSGILILLLLSWVVKSATLSADVDGKYNISNMNISYQHNTAQDFYWIKVSLLSSGSQTDSDTSQPDLSEKFKVENIKLTDNTTGQTITPEGLDTQVDASSWGSDSNYTLSMTLYNKTNGGLEVTPGFVVHYKNYFGFRYTTSVPGTSIFVPPMHSCTVQVNTLIDVTLKTNSTSSTKRILAYGMDGGQLTLSTPNFEDNHGILKDSSGQAGPTYEFPDATVDNKTWIWTPSGSGDLDIVFPSLNNTGVVPGQYSDNLTATLSCE